MESDGGSGDLTRRRDGKEAGHGELVWDPFTRTAGGAELAS